MSFAFKASISSASSSILSCRTSRRLGYLNATTTTTTVTWTTGAAATRRRVCSTLCTSRRGRRVRGLVEWSDSGRRGAAIELLDGHAAQQLRGHWIFAAQQQQRRLHHRLVCRPLSVLLLHMAPGGTSNTPQERRRRRESSWYWSSWSCCFSSRTGSSGGGGGSGKTNTDRNRFQDMYGLPFTVSPDEATNKFLTWARQEQGLDYLLRTDQLRITAAYCPVWSFDVNIRFIVTDQVNNNNNSRTGSSGSHSRTRFDWKPSIFAVYGTQPVVHLPGLSAYAGYSYPRQLVNPVHNVELVFLGDQVVPFGGWMLRDMPQQSNGVALEIYPDPWNTSRGQAFQVLRDELTAIVAAETTAATTAASSSPFTVETQTEVLASRRVYMPTYVFDYQLWGGLQFQAFVSGCDKHSGVSGYSHKLVEFSQQQQVYQASRSFWTNASAVAEHAFRVFSAREVLQPLQSSRAATADWQRTREKESRSRNEHSHARMHDFVDSGTARQYFQANRGKILQHLGGTYEHESGDFDWYREWEQWARNQWERQQQQQQGQQQQSYEYPRDQKPPQTQKKKDYVWDFDPDDPYSVLGIHRGASKEEISAAFRREMMKHHPDVHSASSQAVRERANERTKLITNAYRKLKAKPQS